MEIGDINNFETLPKLQAYAGADPAIYQSRTYTAANTAMEKRGFAYLRHALYLATCMASFADNSFVRCAAKKKAQGKHHYVAMAHVMKKMIRVVFCVFKVKSNSKSGFRVLQSFSFRFLSALLNKSIYRVKYIKS